MNLHIFVREDGSDDPFEEITDLFWFEANGVHDFSGDGSNGRRYQYRFDLECTGAPGLLTIDGEPLL